MRELTLEEQELIAGGSITDSGGGGDIVVVADGGGDGGGDFGDYGGGDYGDYGGGDSGGGGGDGGGGGGDGAFLGSGAAAHVDASALSPDPSIDLTDMYVYPTGVLDGGAGKLVSILIDNNTAPPYSDAFNKVTDTISQIRSNWVNLSQDAKDALTHIDNIVFTDTTRSFSKEDSGTFFFDTSELLASSDAFAASNILHDALHIAIFDRTGDLNQSRGIAAEVAGWQMQVDNAAAIGLSASEVQYLQGLIADPGSQTPRIEQPPYGG